MITSTNNEQRKPVFGHYEGLITTPVTMKPGEPTPPEEDEPGSVLYMTSVVKIPDDIHLTVSPSTPVSTLPEGVVAFSEMAKAAIPKLLLDKMIKTGLPLEKYPTYLFTEEQRTAIYEAIEKDQAKTKIRRTRKGKPGERTERIEDASKPFTELEKKLDLEFSIIIDDNREPIALFRGKSQMEYLVGFGGLGVVKFGQRLSDGKWVAVKIQKYNIENLNALKADLINFKKALAAAKEILEQIRLDNTPEAALYKHIKYSNQMDRIKQINEALSWKEKEIKRQESMLKYKKEQIKSETGFLTEAELQLGEAERTTKDVAKFYSVQVLLEDIEFFEYIGNRGFKDYIDDVGERLDAFLLALEDLKILHDKNIIHGDLKPDNMIYLRKANPRSMKTIDFGMSVQLEPGEETIKVLTRGTALYRAPENTDQQLLHKGSDIYSMGKMFELFLYSSKKWFPEINRYPELKNEIHSLITKMLAQDYNDRPNIDSVIKEFKEIINNHKNRQKPKAPQA